MKHCVNSMEFNNGSSVLFDPVIFIRVKTLLVTFISEMRKTNLVIKYLLPSIKLYFVVWLVDWLIGWLIDWLVDLLIGLLIGLLIYLLIYWLFENTWVQ